MQTISKTSTLRLLIFLLNLQLVSKVSNGFTQFAASVIVHEELETSLQDNVSCLESIPGFCA